MHCNRCIETQYNLQHSNTQTNIFTLLATLLNLQDSNTGSKHLHILQHFSNLTSAHTCIHVYKHSHVPCNTSHSSPLQHICPNSYMYTCTTLLKPQQTHMNLCINCNSPQTSTHMYKHLRSFAKLFKPQHTNTNFCKYNHSQHFSTPTYTCIQTSVNTIICNTFQPQHTHTNLCKYHHLQHFSNPNTHIQTSVNTIICSIFQTPTHKTSVNTIICFCNNSQALTKQHIKTSTHHLQFNLSLLHISEPTRPP